MSEATKLLAKNRRAFHDYEVEETIECGVMLVGTEVKSIRAGQFSFSDSYGRIKDGELWLIGLHITPYDHASRSNHEPERERKLLAHGDELYKMERKVREKGYTLIPLDFHLKRGYVKVNIGLCKGKKLHDKRESIKAKDQKRDADREMRDRY